MAATVRYQHPGTKVTVRVAADDIDVLASLVSRGYESVSEAAPKRAASGAKPAAKPKSTK